MLARFALATPTRYSSSGSATTTTAALSFLSSTTSSQWLSTIHRSISSSNNQGDDNNNDQHSAVKSSSPSTSTSTSSHSEEWIPPNRPLAGDQGNSQLYKQQQELYQKEKALEDAIFVMDTDKEDTDEEEILRRLEQALKLEEELEQEQFQQELLAESAMEKNNLRPSTSNKDDTTTTTLTSSSSSSSSSDTSVDWLATRRAALGQPIFDPNDPTSSTTSSTTIAVLKHQLLTQEEFVTLLESQGGMDITVLLDNPLQRRMGGATGMILCTASSSHHVYTLTKSLIDHLKLRQLDQVGVLGASQTLKRSSHQSSSSSSASALSSTSTPWNVVDCQNYIVHILDATTRTALNLEDLWSGKDPLWKLDYSNESAVDKYVLDHPVPFTYGPNPDPMPAISVTSASSSSYYSTTQKIGKLEKSHFAPHSSSWGSSFGSRRGRNSTNSSSSGRRRSNRKMGR